MKNLIELLTLREEMVFDYLIDRLSKYYAFCLYKKDDYLCYMSNSNTILQAHIDTVSKEPPVFITVNKNILCSPNNVLGGDDRAGIYIILKAVERCYNSRIPLPNLLFTNHEECGGSGMTEFTKRITGKNLRHIDLMVSLDRKGCGEYVVYTESCKEVADYIESFGYIEEYGTFSDCEIFSTNYSIPSVNLSVGYHHAHTKQETLHFDETLMTLERVISIIKSPIKKRYKVTPKKLTYWGYSKIESSNYANYPAYEGYKMYDKDILNYECQMCGVQKNVEWTVMDGESVLMCKQCLSDLGGYVKNQYVE
jgi:hypothetical protein